VYQNILQIDRYKASLNNLIFTDYLDFHFYQEGEFVLSIAIDEVLDKGIKPKEFLKIDFPRVPYPKDTDTFWKLVKLGRASPNTPLRKPYYRRLYYRISHD
jgi:hypothetical protein